MSLLGNSSEFNLDDQQTSLLVRLYDEQNLTVDKLPYTPQYDAIVAEFNRQFHSAEFNHHFLWNVLIKLRKSKRLLRKSKKAPRKQQRTLFP